MTERYTEELTYRGKGALTKRLLTEILEDSSSKGFSDPDEVVAIYERGQSVDDPAWTIRFGGDL